MLIFLVVFQSAAAIADAHQLHQSGAEHVEFNHDHGNSSGVVQDNSDPTYQNTLKTDIKYDCHHCCHCHGSVHTFLVTKTQLPVVSSGNGLTYFAPQAFSLYTLPDLRPPIA